MICLISIVLLHYFKVSLWVEACGASLGCFNVFSNETTVATLPEHLAVLAEHFVLLNVLHKFAVTFFMCLLSNGNIAIHCSNLGETFCRSSFSKCGIVKCPFFVFASSCRW